jgi:hypothetical protein
MLPELDDRLLGAAGLLCLALLAGCAAVPQATIPAGASPAPPALTAVLTFPPEIPAASSSSPVPAASPASEATVSPQPTPEQPPGSFQRTQYALDARLDYAAHTLQVSQQITFTNPETQTLQTLGLVIPPARRSGVFSLQSAAWEDGSPAQPLEETPGWLLLSLPGGLAPGQAACLRLDYRLALPARPAKLGYTNRQTNLGDWYPFIPPYDLRHGWLVNSPAAVGETLFSEPADYHLRFQVTNAPSGLVLAASAAASQTSGGVEYDHPAARSFALSLSPEYQVLTDTLGGTTIASYFFPEHARAGAEALQASRQALALYNELFAPYPYSHLAAVESQFIDGMEYHGLYFLGQEYYAEYRSSPRGYLTALAAHETAHQWWPGLVGSDPALTPWMDEALCTYSERLFYERYYPELADWWWDYRALRFNPHGWVDLTIYEAAGFRQYVDAVYLRGALWLDDVRSQMGDAAFLQALRDYTQTYAQRTAQPADFFAALREAAPVDLGPLHSVYFRAP